MSRIREVKWIALCILRNAERSVLSDHSRNKQQSTAKQRWPLMKCQSWKPIWMPWSMCLRRGWAWRNKIVQIALKVKKALFLIDFAWKYRWEKKMTFFYATPCKNSTLNLSWVETGNESCTYSTASLGTGQNSVTFCRPYIADSRHSFSFHWEGVSPWCSKNIARERPYVWVTSAPLGHEIPPALYIQPYSAFKEDPPFSAANIITTEVNT